MSTNIYTRLLVIYFGYIFLGIGSYSALKVGIEKRVFQGHSKSFKKKIKSKYNLSQKFSFSYLKYENFSDYRKQAILLTWIYWICIIVSAVLEVLSVLNLLPRVVNRSGLFLFALTAILSFLYFRLDS